jgi:hypothetical protein
MTLTKRLAWKHCGFLSLEILKHMGFRIVAANGGATFGNPVGLDGVFEASCLPYHPTMDAAVDAVLAPPSPGGKETGPVPHRMSEVEHRADAVRISADGLACTKAICNYIHDTYGRFPGGTDAMHLMWVLQSHGKCTTLPIVVLSSYINSNLYTLIVFRK